MANTYFKTTADEAYPSLAPSVTPYYINGSTGPIRPILKKPNYVGSMPAYLNLVDSSHTARHNPVMFGRPQLNHYPNYYHPPQPVSYHSVMPSTNLPAVHPHVYYTSPHRNYPIYPHPYHHVILPTLPNHIARKRDLPTQHEIVQVKHSPSNRYVLVQPRRRKKKWYHEDDRFGDYWDMYDKWNLSSDEDDYDDNGDEIIYSLERERQRARSRNGIHLTRISYSDPMRKVDTKKNVSFEPESTVIRSPTPPKGYKQQESQQQQQQQHQQPQADSKLNANVFVVKEEKPYLTTSPRQMVINNTKAAMMDGMPESNNSFPTKAQDIPVRARKKK